MPPRMLRMLLLSFTVGMLGLAAACGDDADDAASENGEADDGRPAEATDGGRGTATIQVGDQTFEFLLTSCVALGGETLSFVGEADDGSGATANGQLFVDEPDESDVFVDDGAGADWAARSTDPGSSEVTEIQISDDTAVGSAVFQDRNSPGPDQTTAPGTFEITCG